MNTNRPEIPVLQGKEEAIDFVKQTNVDALAVSVGTLNGTYHGTPKLEFELLADLHQMVEVPLVLHGGSGTGDDNLEESSTDRNSES